MIKVRVGEVHHITPFLLLRETCQLVKSCRLEHECPRLSSPDPTSGTSPTGLSI